MYRIKEVKTSSDLKLFLRFQERLYKDSPQFVPNLRLDERSIFTTNPCLEYSKLKMWIVFREAEQGEKRVKHLVVGRIAGIINPHYNELYKTKRARFGWIEFEEDFEIAKLLIETAEAWAASEGMDEIHGPLGYNTWFKQGMLVEGFENMPPINCIYNFPYYPLYMERLGFAKEADWIQYKLPASQGVTPELQRINDMLLKRYPLRVESVKKLKKRADIVELFFKHYNEAFRDVHNFVPITDKEIQSLGKHYIKMLKSELNCFVLDNEDNLVAFGICFPSFSEGYRKAKGRLFPFGWIHILRSYFSYDIVDLMMVGSDPKWGHKGVSAIFHNFLANSFIKNGVRYAITNPQIEDNSAIKVWDRYEGRELFMRRRCFIKIIETKNK